MKLEIGDRVKILSTKRERLYLNEVGQIVDISDYGNIYIAFDNIKSEWFQEDDLDPVINDNKIRRLEKRVTELEEIIQILIRKG